MRSRVPFLALLVSIVAIPPQASAQRAPAPKGGARAAHPAVDVRETCEACHAEATPGPFREWKEGTHGLALVKCFVCHGSTGADFRRKPSADRCTGCHAEQVASMRGPAMKGKDCFTCHSAHALNPHATSASATAAAKLGADRLAPMVTVEGRIPPAAPAPAPAAAQPGAAATPSPAASPAPAPPQGQPGTAAPAAPAGPDAEKDVKQSQPHPPTDR